MSVVIKSNRASLKNFGTYASLITTASEAYTAYKNRVEADGGTVMNENATIAAFDFLIKNGLLGAARTWVSSLFGLKLSGSNILKAYSLSGEDLVSVSFGSGLLPTLNNGIKFNNTVSDTVNGTILTSLNKIDLRGKGTFIGHQRFAQAPSRNFLTIDAALTLHNDEPNASPLLTLQTPLNSNYTRLRRQVGNNPSQNNSGSAAYANIDLNSNAQADVRYQHRTSENIGTGIGYRDGLAVTFPPLSPANFDGFKAYIDVGGANYQTGNSPTRYFSDTTFKHFYMFDELTEEQVNALVKLVI